MKKTSQAFTNPDKVFWPDLGYTKGDLIGYYENIAPVILPYLADRPNSLNRFPDGITGVHFFQRNVARGSTPDFVETATIRAKTGRNVRYVLCNNKETPLFLADLGCIEVHPWNSRVGMLAKPDYLILDLDPGERAAFGDCIKVAQAAHEILGAIRVPNLCKTSGKRGLHIYVPLGAKYPYERVRQFGDALACAINKKIPELTSMEHWPAKRKDKIHVDIMRNAIGQTAAAPYSLRPVAGAPVSTPLLWSEVKVGLRPDQFTIHSIFARLKKKGDLWKPVLGKGIDLEKAMRSIQKRLT
jgi:bifunctional non-homologous end joining protein LigD